MTVNFGVRPLKNFGLEICGVPLGCLVKWSACRLEMENLFGGHTNVVISKNCSQKHLKMDSYSHVLDGATEGMRHRALVNGLLAQAKVGQLDVA